MRKKTVNASARRRVSWDFLRVVAISAVVIQHATNLAPQDHHELSGLPFVFSLQFGANSLLVVSAFFVCASLAKTRPLKFLADKLVRLIPAYLVALITTYLLLTQVAPERWVSLTGKDLLGNALLLPGLVPGANMVDVNYWTLQLQMLAFLSASLLTLCLRWNTNRAAVLTWVLVLSPIGLRWLSEHFTAVHWCFHNFLMHRIHLLGIGVGIWLWSRRKISLWHLLLLLAAAGIAHDIPLTDPSSIALILFIGAMCLAARGPDWSFLAGRVQRLLAWLASISFGIYLVNHQIGALISLGLVSIGVGSWPRLLVILSSLVLLGWLLTVLVQRPIHRLLTRRRLSSTPVEPKSPGVTSPLPEKQLVAGQPI